MTTFPVSIITPNGVIFKGDTEFLSAPGVEGSFGILAKHAPFVTLLLKGIVKVVSQEQAKFFAIAKGILEVNGKGDVLLLASYAASFDEKTKAQEALSKL